MIQAIETSRLSLRRWLTTDFETFLAIHQDSEIARANRYRAAPHTVVDIWNHFLMLIGHWEVRPFGEYCVFEKSSSKPIGNAGFNQNAGIRGVQMGWAIGENSRGRGYATEAINALLKECVRRNFDDRLVAIIDENNQRSQYLARSCGFTNEGPFSAYGDGFEIWVRDWPAKLNAVL